MEPVAAERRANWFRLRATNSSMITPKRYGSQLALPAAPYINGMIRTAVRVGAIFATEMAESSVKLRHPARNDPAAGLFAKLSIRRYKSSFASGPCKEPLCCKQRQGSPLARSDERESQSVDSV